MIFTLFIAAVFASQSFRAIGNADSVTGEYKEPGKITITHTSEEATPPATNLLGYGKVEKVGADDKAVFTEKVATGAYPSNKTVEKDFDYLAFLKSEEKTLIVAYANGTKIAEESFASEIKAKTATLDALVNGSVSITTSETETGAYTTGKLFSYENGAEIANLTYGTDKFNGMIDVSKLYSTEKGVMVGYVTAIKDSKSESSELISVTFVDGTEKTINNDGKVEIKIMDGPGKYQKFTKDLQKDEGPVVVATGIEGKVVANTTEAYKLFYAKFIEDANSGRIMKVELEKAPNVSLKFVTTNNSAEPKILIVSGSGFNKTEVMLDVTGTPKPITLTEGKSGELEWTDFKKTGNKTGAIYVRDAGKIASVSTVIEDAKITLTNSSFTDEGGRINFTMTTGLITKMPTHLCIYSEVNSTIINGTANCTQLSWNTSASPLDQVEKSFEYTYAQLSNTGDYFAAMTDFNVTTESKVSAIGEPIKIQKSKPVEPTPTGAFSAVATIFAAVVSLLVFAF